MRLSIFKVDAFADRQFVGNPAAVVPLQNWLPDATLQAIAAENNLSETAYIVPAAGRYALRWFTPVKEVKLCGHATLATAWVLFERLGYAEPEIRFDTASGELRVRRDDGWLWMDFPADPAEPATAPAALLQGLGTAPREVLAAADYVAVFDSVAQIRSLTPDFRELARLDRRGVIATAPGEDCDFVSRFFAPKAGIDEDPVTGSAHCTLAPLWAQRLGKDELVGRQLSRRGGTVRCAPAGVRVRLGGQVMPYLVGNIDIG